jgi:hypothetical protein
MVTQEQLAQAILELKSSQEKTDEQMKRTDERLNKVAKLVGNISNNQGGVAEEFFINSIATTQKLGGIQYDFMETNAHRHIKSQNLRGEFDIVLVNGKDVAIVEVKYNAHENDIDNLITKKINNFQKLYPEYNNYNHHLGLASFKVNEKVKQKALDNNVMILQRKGDIIETILPSL